MCSSDFPSLFKVLTWIGFCSNSHWTSSLRPDWQAYELWNELKSCAHFKDSWLMNYWTVIPHVLANHHVHFSTIDFLCVHPISWLFQVDPCYNHSVRKFDLHKHRIQHYTVIQRLHSSYLFYLIYLDRLPGLVRVKRNRHAQELSVKWKCLKLTCLKDSKTAFNWTYRIM